MKIGEMVRSILLDAANVEAVVGTRIYPVRAPQQAALPCIVYSIPEVMPAQHKTGPALDDLVTIDMVCWGVDYDVLMELALKVRYAIDVYEGGTFGSDSVRGAHFVTLQTVTDDDAELIGVLVRCRVKANWAPPA